MKRDYEQAATVELTLDGGEIVRLSAILQRDPHHLTWNKIRLLGTETEKFSLYRLDDEQGVRWSLFKNENWPAGSAYQTFGRGFLRDRGVTQGINIDPEGIQAFGDIEVFEKVEVVVSDRWTEQFAQYWFLQRPYEWSPSRRRFSKPRGLSRHGDWQTIRTLGLKFRHAQIGHARNDERLSREVELVDIPAVEVAPLGVIDEADFAERADDLWFSLRILLVFRYRQYVSPLMTYKSGWGRCTQTWHSSAVEPKEKRPDGETPPFYGSSAKVFARALPTLAHYRNQRELLHGAAYGYAESFKASVSESNLTSCVEALERLVCAFEEIQGLSREAVDRKAWRPIAKALKRTIDEVSLDAATRARLKRSLASPAPLSLQERIERMARTYRRHWAENDLKLLNGLNRLIKTRNDIVHGRLIRDYNALYIDLERGRAVFERLFLNLMGCHKCDLPRYSHIMMYDEQRSLAPGFENLSAPPED